MYFRLYRMFYISRSNETCFFNGMTYLFIIQVVLQNLPKWGLFNLHRVMGNLLFIVIFNFCGSRHELNAMCFLNKIIIMLLFNLLLQYLIIIDTQLRCVLIHTVAGFWKLQFSKMLDAKGNFIIYFQMPLYIYQETC